MSHPQHRTWAEIDRAALLHNVAALRHHLPPGVQMMAVVKANAYGHGVGLVAPALAREVEFFGVANLAEALELHERATGPATLILGPSLPVERGLIAQEGFHPSISNLAEAQDFEAHAARLGRTAPVHLVIDTGMGRIGTWEEEAPEFVRAVRRLPHLRIAGVASHLPVADEDESYTRAQLERFRALVQTLHQEGLPPCPAHVENSAGLLGFPQQAGDMVRAGLALYGSSPLPALQAQLHQVITWKTRVTLLREVAEGRGVSYGRTFITPHPMRIATLGVGYADGFRRHLQGRGAEVLIQGRRCPLLGRVTMDQVMVDVTALPDVEVGEEVVLLGRQGRAEILATEMAEKAGTIAWDIFTGLGNRVARVPISEKSQPAS